MKPEKQNLIRDLLDENSAREATLLAGAHILRRRRHWRAARRVCAVVALCAVVAGLAMRKSAPPPHLAAATPKAPAVSQVHEMTDEELLALFPNTPVALASLPDGKKRLLFPRPGDEQKFIRRL